MGSLSGASTPTHTAAIYQRGERDTAQIGPVIPMITVHAPRPVSPDDSWAGEPAASVTERTM